MRCRVRYHAFAECVWCSFVLTAVAVADVRCAICFILYPLAPLVVCDFGYFFRVGVSAVCAGIRLHALACMRCRVCHHALAEYVRCYLAFAADTVTNVSVSFIKLVDYPFVPFMVDKHGNVFRITMSANSTSESLNALFGVCRFSCYNTCIVSTVIGFACITTASSFMSTVTVGRPIRPLMISHGNIFCFRMHTSLASICLNTICCARGLDGYNAIVPRVRQSFNCTTVVIHALALVVFVTVRRPVCPSVLRHRDFLGLCMTACAAGISHNTGRIAGRRYSFNTAIPIVVFLLIAVADVAIHSVRIFVVNLPFAPFVAFEFSLNAAISLAVTDVRVYAVIYPFAKIMAKCLSRFGFGGTAIRAGVCGLGAFGAAGSAALNAAIPVVRLCFFRGTAF